MSCDIVITGTACVTSLGLDRETTWRSVCEGRCGIGPLAALESGPSPDRDGGQAPDLPAGEDAGQPREVRYLRRVIRDAWRESVAGSRMPYPPERCGTVLGTTLHGMRSAGNYLRSGDLGTLSMFLAGATAGQAIDSRALGGWSASPCAACASGLTAVIMAVHLLESGRLDLVVAGGYDTISEYAYGGFQALRLVSFVPPRPFTRNRSGMKVAEGYGVLVLERRSDAAARGAPTLARILGTGGSSDAHHLSEPHPEGEGAARAIRRALSTAGLRTEEVGFITAHATGTLDNDAAEVRALRTVFQDTLHRIPVLALKSHLGHALGGAGAIELALSVLALRDRRVPPAAGLVHSDLEFSGLDVVTGGPRQVDVRSALCSSFGFGGSNACVVLGAFSTEEPPANRTVAMPRDRTEDAVPCDRAGSTRSDREEVWITGVGVLVPGAVGNEAFLRRVRDRERPRLTGDTGPVPEDQLAPLFKSRRVRRMSRYVKLTLAAATLACRDAQIDPVSPAGESCGALLGTTHGSAEFCLEYYRQIVREGVESANPSLFAEGVPNAASAHLSMMLGLKGPCQTLIGSRTSGLDALSMAALQLSSGERDRMIVSAADEYATLNKAAYGHCGLYARQDAADPFTDSSGFVSGEASVALVLERAGSARRRGIRAVGVFESGTGTRFRVPADRDALRRAADCLVGIGRPGCVVSSANATWIDRYEQDAIRIAYAGSGSHTPSLSAWYGLVAESFSAGPLVGLAALLLGGRLPSHPEIKDSTPVMDPCNGVGILSTDYAGTFSVARIRVCAS